MTGGDVSMILLIDNTHANAKSVTMESTAKMLEVNTVVIKTISVDGKSNFSFAGARSQPFLDIVYFKNESVSGDLSRYNSNRRAMTINALRFLPTHETMKMARISINNSN